MKAFRPLVSLLVLIFLLALLAASFYGLRLYLRFGPAPLCRQIPVESRAEVKTLRLSDPMVREVLGSKRALACPEGRRAFTEWYMARVWWDDYFMDVLFDARGADHSWGLAGFGVRDRKTLKPVSLNFSLGKKVNWAEHSCQASMLTPGPDGKWATSEVRHIEEGPEKGQFIFDLAVKTGRLHLTLEPVAPGLVTDQVAADRERPGSWLQYACITMLARARGQVTIHLPSGELIQREIGDTDAGPAYAYLEHMWGQIDRPNLRNFTRQYWEWGGTIDFEKTAVVMAAQYDNPKSGINSFAQVWMEGEAFPFAHRPPEQAIRWLYRRLEPVGGVFYPQELHIWAFSSPPAAIINLSGFVRATFFEWQAFDFIGQAGIPGRLRTWTKPLRSESDFYKGAQAREKLPPPAEGLWVQHGPEGNHLFWKHSCSSAEEGDEFAYWIFRIEKPDRLASGIPIGMVTCPAETSAGTSTEKTAERPEEKNPDNVSEENSSLPSSQPEESLPPGERTAEERNELDFLDPAGTRESIYKIISVRVPATLLHQRLMAGYTRCSEPAEVSPPPSSASPLLAAALDRAHADEFTLPLDQEFLLPENIPPRRLRLVKEAESGALEFHLEKGASGQWEKEQTLRPRFSPRTQIQSFAALMLSPEQLALAWSERTPVLDTDWYTDWEIFVSLFNLAEESFQVFDVSLSDFDSVEVTLEKNEAGLRVYFLECSAGFCIPARQTLSFSLP